MIKTSELINLTSLLDFSNKLNENPEREFILNSILFTLIGKLKLKGAAIYYQRNDYYELVAAKGKAEIDENILFKVPDHFIEIDIDNNDKYFLALGKKFDDQELDERERRYIDLILSIAKTAYKNYNNLKKIQSEKNKAERKSQLLETLFQISRDFSGLSSEQKILKAMSFNLMGQLAINKFAMISLSNGTREVISNSLKISAKEIPDEVFKVRRTDFTENLGIKNLDPSIINIISPMKIAGNIYGYLLIGSSEKGEYDQQDLSFIESLSTTAISALENERLINEEIDKKKMESELSIALEIQKKLFPKSPLRIENYEIYGMTSPTGTVGGDYYDYVKIHDEKYLFLIADVSGKGMPASILMSNMQAVIHSLAPLDLEITDLVNRVNDIVYKNTSKDMFITAFICLLNPKTGELEYVNAGHFPPILTEKPNNTIELDKGGVVLGFLPSPIDYEKEKVSLNDTLFLYTDGLNEAKNTEGEELGVKNIKEKLKDISDESPEFIIRDFFEYVFTYAKDTPQYDDISIVVIKKRG